MKIPEPTAIGQETARALGRHAGETKDAIESGDPQRIRRLYTDLAADLLIAADHDGTVPVLSYHETAAAVAAKLSTTTGLHLDVGCGPNPLASILVAVGTDRPVIGVDIGPGMVTLARRVARDVGVAFHGVVTDAEHLPFCGASFGSVVCDDTIEHLPDDASGASELARVTEPGGRIALATPNRTRLPVLLRKLRDRVTRRRADPSVYYAANSHLREYTWTDLERLVRPYLHVLERGHVPWSGSVAKRIISQVTALPGGRAAGRVVLLVLTPKT